MGTREERNRYFRKHHYHWRKVKEGRHERWALIGPDGQEVTEWQAEDAVSQKEQYPQPIPPQWARALIQRRPLILDTETTGLDTSAEVIDLALVELDGTVLFNSLIQCRGEIPLSVVKVHGIDKRKLVGQPTFPEIWPSLIPHLSRDIVIYHAAFDVPLLKQTAARYDISIPKLRTHCLMIAYTEYAVGPRGAYQRLETACKAFGIPAGEHRALSDAQAARQVLLHLARLGENT